MVWLYQAKLSIENTPLVFTCSVGQVRNGLAYSFYKQLLIHFRKVIIIQKVIGWFDMLYSFI